MRHRRLSTAGVGSAAGPSAAEEDLFDKLEAASIFTAETTDTLRRMRGCRNILVHEYGRVSDEIVFDTITTSPDDFEHFARAVLDTLR
jgi:uncharacterized protein YutE (UPF0331/DUF86 family)